MRNFTKEREKYNRQVNPGRKENRENVGTCQVCGQAKVAHSHEIAAGHARENCLHDALCQLQVCAKCHPAVQHWKPAKQIAALVKWLTKRICMNYCEYKQLAYTAVEPADVLLYITMDQFDVDATIRKVAKHGEKEGSGKTTRKKAART